MPKKIKIPVCEDTIFDGVVSFLILCGLIGFVAFGVLMLIHPIFIIGVIFFNWVGITMWCKFHNKKWYDRLMPIEVRGDCDNG